MIRRIENDYELISDGTQTVQFQIRTGYLEILNAPSQPLTSETGGKLSAASGIITLTPPTKGWIKSNPGDFAEIVVLGVF